MRIIAVGDSALRIELGDAIDESTVRAVQLARHALTASSMPGLAEIVPTYTALTVFYSPPEVATAAGQASGLADWLTTRIGEALRRGTEGEVAHGHTIEVPVRYGGESGPDLSDVAAHAALSADEVVRRHTQATYRVAMLGFTPGFPYLIGLPKELAMPRLSTPRLRVPAGSVGLAGEQTGIYPRATPGGWRLIGRTPLTLFDAGSDRPSLLQPGDTVRFRAVTREAFDAWAERAVAGRDR